MDKFVSELIKYMVKEGYITRRDLFNYNKVEYLVKYIILKNLQ